LIPAVFFHQHHIATRARETMFSSFTDFLKDIKEKGERTFAQITNKAAFNRLVFASVLIATADGNFSTEEKTALAQLIAKQLPQFRIAEILQSIDDAKSKLDFDLAMGRLELFDEVGKSKGDEATAIVRAAIYIGSADGNFDDKEKAIAKTICERVGLTPSHYGL
jgi:tellurite resistance protein TerB